MKLDHIMYAVSDLQEGILEIESLTGVKAEFGGFHPGNGTCNALLSFDNGQYLEIIAPDPGQDLAGTLGQELLDHNFSGIRTWAVETTDYGKVTSVLDQFNYQYNVIDMTRTRPDGVKLDWQIMFVTGHPFGNFMPFFINWLESPHPADSTPKGCVLDAYSVQLIENGAVFGQLMTALGVEVEVLEGPGGMRAVIDSPNGRVMLH